MKKTLILLSTISLSALMSACSGPTSGQQATNQPDAAHSREWQEKQREQMQKVSQYFFDEMDTNQDGTVSYKEFMAFQRKIFKEADANHDGKLTLEEFIGEGKREKHRIHEWKEEQREDGQQGNYGDRAGGARDERPEDHGYDQNNGGRSGNYNGERATYDDNSGDASEGNQR